jgi:hypothetical protein
MHDQDDEMQEIDYSDDEMFSGGFSRFTTESGDLLDDSNPFGYDDFDEQDEENEEEDDD